MRLHFFSAALMVFALGATAPGCALSNIAQISEDRVDVVVGSTVTPNSLAMIDVAAEAETPMISMAASSRIVEPVDNTFFLPETSKRGRD